MQGLYADLRLELLQHIKEYLPEEDSERIIQAFEFAAYVHRNQKRDSGEPFIIHPVATACYLAKMHMDGATLQAALLHDVVEDQSVSINLLEQQFSREVATLIDGATNLKLSAKAAAQEGWQFANLNKLLMASANDIRVLLIKLSDRLHNAETFGYSALEKRERKARETLLFYSPLATRLGVWRIKVALETLSLEVLEPAVYKHIRKMIDVQISEQAPDYRYAAQMLSDRMKELGIEAEVHLLPPNPYTIYEIMQAQRRPITDIREMLTIALVVPQELDCYTAMGIVHQLWMPIPGKFDDYIAFPKENYYQSLHTTVVGPGKHLLKVRIRTRNMHERAEYGVFVHWLYPDANTSRQKPITRRAWQDQLAELSREAGTPQEFMDLLMSNILPDRLCVFTPKGDVKELPKGATALDLAYFIHTHLGHRSRASRVNGELRPLSYKLENGDLVEIIPVEESKPNYDWLNPTLRMYTMTRTRDSITRYFRRLPEEEKIRRGEQIIRKELNLLGIGEQIFGKGEQEKDLTRLGEIAQIFNFRDVRSFYLAVGSARLINIDVALKLLERTYGFKPKTPKRPDAPPDPLVLSLLEQPFELALECCHPAPGDQMIGLVVEKLDAKMPNDTIVVHRADCRKGLLAASQYRLVEVAWHPKKPETISVTLVVHVKEREGLLRDITCIINDAGVNIADVRTTFGKNNKRTKLTAVVEIEQASQLVAILHIIDRLPNVVNVSMLVVEGG